jgi:DNA repair protein RecO (recombination protein O)
MLSKAQIIVLNTIKYGDNGLVVQCYSNSGGKLSLFLRGTGRNKSNAAYLHRLNILDVEIFSGGKGMPLIKEIVPAFRLDSLRTDLCKGTVAIFICELILKGVREIEPNERLYTFLRESILSLEQCGSGSANFPAFFIVHFCKMSGFEPFDNYRDDSLPVFNINSASFVPCRGHYKGEKEKRDDIEFSREESILLHQLLNVSPNELNSIKSSGNSRYGFIKQMLLYFSTHLGYPVELKSLEVLHELF